LGQATEIYKNNLDSKE